MARVVEVLLGLSAEHVVPERLKREAGDFEPALQRSRCIEIVSERYRPIAQRLPAWLRHKSRGGKLKILQRRRASG